MEIPLNELSTSIFDDSCWDDDSQYDYDESAPKGKAKTTDAIRQKNRLAAKKWREKRNDTLLQLETANDVLRIEALRLSRFAQTLKDENIHLEGNLSFFQAFMAQFIPRKY